jgi:hypothetical protein
MQVRGSSDTGFFEILGRWWDEEANALGAVPRGGWSRPSELCSAVQSEIDMGATGWEYTTPYDPDPDIALQDLRDRVFETGDYLRPGEILRLPRHRDSRPPLPAWFWAFYYLARVISLFSFAASWLVRGGREPRTIEELLHDSGENGTHSILDIDHTADFPEFMAATPLTRCKLLDHFGTTTPTAKQFAEARDAFEEVMNEIKRWEAVYFTLHDENGQPSEYVFIGVSGD